ncbi:MAG: LysR family transcriptional regulator, partial [Deltaproteobacteria bacterium]
MLPSLDALLTFETAARLSSFSAAARELHVTQGAISHRIRNLEEQLGTRLFDRTARGVRLTAEGRILAAAVTDAFERLRDGLDRLDRRRHGDPLMVSCSPSFAIRWLVPHLPQLQARHPDLDVRISADDRVVQPGRAGIDVCIRYGPG